MTTPRSATRLRDSIEGTLSRLEPLFDDRSGRSGKPQIVEWHEQGRLRDQPKALAEALTCASFLGRTSVAEYLLKQGVDPSGRRGHRFGRPPLGMRIVDSWKRFGCSSAQRLRSKREACMAAQQSARQSGRLSTNRDAIICKIIEELLNAGARWTIRNIPQGTSALTRPWGVSVAVIKFTIRGLAPRAARREVSRSRRARAWLPTRAAWPIPGRRAGSSARRVGAGT